MPTGATPMPKGFARQLLAYEVVLGDPVEAKDPPAFRVCEKLRRPLSKLMGVDGFHSLQSRALALACAEVPWLCALEIRPDGSLEGLEKGRSATGRARDHRGRARSGGPVTRPAGDLYWTGSKPRLVARDLAEVDS